MAVDQRSKVIYQIEVDATKAVAMLGRVDKNTARVAKGLDRLRDQAKGAGRFLRNAFIGGGLIAAVTRLGRGFTNAADAAADLNARLQATAGGPGAAADSLRNLFEVAQRLGVPLETLVASFQKFGIALPTATLDQLENSLETISQVLVTTGTSVQGTNAVLLQLAQGFGSGALRGDEFKSVLENAPALLQAWAAAGGRAGESLKELRDESFFTAESFINLNSEIRRLAEEQIGLSEPANTVQRALVRIGNAFQFVFAQVIAEGGGSPLDPFVNALNSLADITIPALNAALAILGPALEGVVSVLGVAVEVVTDVSEAFSDLASEFSDTEDALDDLVSPFEEAFLVKIPGSVKVIATAVTEGLRVFFGAIKSIFTTAIVPVRTLFALLRGDDAAQPFRDAQARWSGLLDGLKKGVDNVNVSLGTFDRLRSKIASRNAAAQAFDPNAERAAVAGRTGIIPSASPAKKGGSAAASAALRLQKLLEAAARKSAKAFEKLGEEAAKAIKEAAAFSSEFEADIKERLRLQEDELRLIQASDADRDKLRDQLTLETEVRKLRADAMAEENKFLAAQINLAADQLEGGVGGAILAGQQKIRDSEFAREAADDAADAYKETFADALEPVKGLLSDVFSGSLDDAQSWAERLTQTLDDILGSFVDKLLDQSFDAIASSLAQGALGGGGSGQGGFLSSIFGSFGGGTGGGFGVSNTLVGPPQPGGGGGFGGLGGIAGGLGLGALAGGLFSSVFNSDSGTALESTLDPLSDSGISQQAPKIEIINNGQNLQVDSTTYRSNGDYQLIVSAAVDQTRSVYQRDMRKGFGGFSESLSQANSIDRSV